MKFKTLFMIAAALFAIIPMVLYAVFAGMFVGNSGKDQFNRQLIDLVQNQASTLSVYLDSVHTEINTIADMEEIKTVANGGKSDDAGNILVRITQEHPSVEYIRLVDKDGKVVLGQDIGTVVENYKEYSNYKENVLYINDVGSAEKTGSVEGSTMVIQRKVGDCKLILYYTISATTDERQFISTITNNSTFYNQGRVIIIDPRMNWTTGSGYNNNLRDQYPDEVLGRISSLQDGVMSEIITYSKDSGAMMATEYCAAMLRVGGEDGLVVLASCPTNRAGIFSGSVTSSVITAVALLAVLCIVGAILIAIVVTKPLKTIEETLVKIRRGDHEARISAVSNNEYGQISRAFNNLVDEIVVSEDRYRTITDMSDNIIFEWNFKTNEVFFSNNFNKKFSYRAPSDHFGDSFLLKAKVHPDDNDRYRSDLETLGRGEEFKHNEYRIKNIYGDFIWVLIRTATLHDKDNNPLKIVGVMVDIDRAKKSEQQLTARASFDSLTELYNRETIENQIDNEINLSEARKSELAVLFVDGDDFKHVNDQYSHATGDQVLKFVARTVQNIVGDYGFAGRYGGDEFIACIRNSEVNEPALAAQDIIARLDEGFTADTGEHLSVSVSIGIAVIKDDYNTRVEYLIGKADDAMYSVKKAGKSNYAFI